jgi:hypothetical protein
VGAECVVADLISTSKGERRMWVPAATLMLASSLVVALFG